MAVWVPCEWCGEWWCRRHAQHVAECLCPPIECWLADPYGAGMWVSGFPAACLACGAAAGTLQVIDEWFDVQDRVWVGTVECPECHERSSYTRRGTTKQRRVRRRRLVQLALPFGNGAESVAQYKVG